MGQEHRGTIANIADFDITRFRTRAGPMNAPDPLIVDYVKRAGFGETYSWGSAVLAYLYSSLCKCAKKNSCTFSGCAFWLQAWAWWRMPVLAPANPNSFAFPYASRFNAIGCLQQNCRGSIRITNSSRAERVSECFIKPLFPVQNSNHICNLTPWDIAMLSMHYIQKGLLFKKPSPLNNQQDFINNFLDNLKQSISIDFFHFYPLSGHLVTQITQNPPSYSVLVDCSGDNNNPGARFIYANLDSTIHDILSPIDTPSVVNSLFDLDRAINHDGHTMPLLSIQVTELLDGVFKGCSMNHSLGDGTSFWNFFNTWSEIFQAQGQGYDHENVPISRQPFHHHWFPEGYGPLINLPFKHHDEFATRFEAPNLRERLFHFTTESITKLKAKANRECNTNTRIKSISGSMFSFFVCGSSFILFSSS
ncbi:uncharacterized acetyltransferase At3g50280-like [Vicia villosa]|uniref:uncharacterized acetyltransferase At3g50280-like n=1 Tax=Vicia villosa TaxID=3911 RepID=UPI00273B94A1|nr:uncharacterized acetyltransferase At3g50280-like [Vicia villosa]